MRYRGQSLIYQFFIPSTLDHLHSFVSSLLRIRATFMRTSGVISLALSRCDHGSSSKNGDYPTTLYRNT